MLAVYSRRGRFSIVFVAYNIELFFYHIFTERYGIGI